MSDQKESFLKMNELFSLELCSDLDFEGMVVDLSYENTRVALINYDNGVNNIEIKMFPQSENTTFKLDDFFNALEKAKKLAIKCAKEDELHNS